MASGTVCHLEFAHLQLEMGGYERKLKSMRGLVLIERVDLLRRSLEYDVPRPSATLETYDCPRGTVVSAGTPPLPPAVGLVAADVPLEQHKQQRHLLRGHSNDNSNSNNEITHVSSDYDVLPHYRRLSDRSSGVSTFSSASSDGSALSKTASTSSESLSLSSAFGLGANSSNPSGRSSRCSFDVVDASNRPSAPTPAMSGELYDVPKAALVDVQETYDVPKAAPVDVQETYDVPKVAPVDVQETYDVPKATSTPAVAAPKDAVHLADDYDYVNFESKTHFDADNECLKRTLPHDMVNTFDVLVRQSEGVPLAPPTRRAAIRRHQNLQNHADTPRLQVGAADHSVNDLRLSS